MLKKVLPFIPLLILYGFTINLLIVVGTTSITLQKPHYVGFGILIISTLLFLINAAAGHLGTMLLLFTGAFFQASVYPWVITKGIGINNVVITFSPHYLLLFVLFLIINAVHISGWMKKIFGSRGEKSA